MTAHISTQDAEGSWSYESQLDVRDEQQDGERVVWKPSVIHPELADHDGYTLKAVPTAPKTAVLSREGTVLNERDQPGLSQVIDQLEARHATRAGTPALDVRITPQFGDGESTTLAHVVKSKPGAIRTTIDPALQRAAESAVVQSSRASVVAVQPSTGEILAVANSAKGEMNPALEDVEAPGSVFEIVTSAALLEQRTVSPTTVMDRVSAAIGRGEVRLNVLNLASITATVKSGTFKQPLLVTADLVGADQTQAERPLSGRVAQQLRAIMNHNASQGTGAEVMAGSSGAFGSMAGLADQGTGQAAHGWFTAFNGDAAVASIAPSSGEGVANAGFITRAVLDADRRTHTPGSQSPPS
nr:penicillin-binding transpeptidase domain-containing protein [Streptomyces parvus]